jgi:hypothetical protein
MLGRLQYLGILTFLKACSVSTALDLLMKSDSMTGAGRDLNLKVTAINQQCTYIHSQANAHKTELFT